MRLVILGIVGTVVGLLAGIGIVAIGFMPEEASQQAANTDGVFDIMVIVTSGIAGLVTAILVAALFLFRERRGETRVAPPVHGHHGLEVIWTAIPAVIVIALTGISWKALNDNEGGKPDLKITVWGQQFDWTYDYPDAKLDEHPPAGRPGEREDRLRRAVEGRHPRLLGARVARADQRDARADQQAPRHADQDR